MDKYIIEGGGRLHGKIRVHSAKNTVLPLLAASVLTDEAVTIRRIPPINDVENMLRILAEVGCVIKRQRDSAVIDSSNAVSHEIPALMLALPAGEKSKGFRYPLHHPKALFDEDVLCLGSAVYAFTAIQWLNQAR